MNDLLMINARAVFRDRIEEDTRLLIRNGVIEAINPPAVDDVDVIDLQGQLLIPGLVDLHCDALEKEVEPRAGVQFPLDFACAQADRRNALAGITTVYHALSFANDELGVRNNQMAATLAAAMNAWNRHGLVDNRVHVRYEVTDDSAPELLLGLMREGLAQMISFMDHTPGQGQFKDVAAFRAFHARNYRKSEEEVDAILADKARKAEGALMRMNMLADAAREHGVPLASHDDDNQARVELLHSLGASISEFPINEETAQVAQRLGLATVFGAPNVIRGQSQSGSMKAMDAIRAGVADCLCSDYTPATLLPAAFRIRDEAGLSLPEAIALVTLNPARAAGLSDRGEIALGRRADLVMVRDCQGLPLAERVWVAGRPVATAITAG